MEPTPNFADQLDDYLLGRLSPQEADAFAARAAQDPLLAQELRLQQDVVAGLRRARAAQLKTRLEQLPTPAAPTFTVGQWVGFGVASVAVVAGALSLYLAQQPDRDLQRADSARQAAQVYTPSEVEEPSLAAAAPTPAPVAEEPSAADALTEARPEAAIESPQPSQAKPSPQANGSMPTAEPLYVARKKTTTQRAGNTASSPAALNTDTPDEEAGNAGSIDKPGVSAPASGKVVENNEIKTKPDVIIRQADELAYQYFDNRLFLYGSFGDAIYELLELVSAKEGRRLYVFYKDRFYTVQRNVREVTPLQPVTDSKLEGELTLLRKKKTD